VGRTHEGVGLISWLFCVCRVVRVFISFFKIIILYFEIKQWIIARNMDTGRVRKRVD
jgi:hypothetical protein